MEGTLHNGLLADMGDTAMRTCPAHLRQYDTICNQGTCSRSPVGDTGYCVYHSSDDYASFAKWRGRIIKALLVFLIAPPILVTIGALLWRLAIWALLEQ